MAIEGKRGCGYRKIGGLYLVGAGIGIECGRLPYNLDACPVCGAGVKQSRGFTWLKAKEFFGGNCKRNCGCHELNCYVCLPTDDRYGLMWVGKRQYTPESFIREAEKMGISKRIAAIPKNLEFGRTRILLAHPEAGRREKETKETLTGKKIEKCPAIFYGFTPKAVEQIITEKQSKSKRFMKKLEKRGITPVVVPDNDEDHQKPKKRKKAKKKVGRKKQKKRRRLK